MSNVYICCIVNGMNVLPAQEFSDNIPKFIYNGPPITFNVQDAISEIQENISDATPGDYLVLCGDPILMGLCAIEFYEQTGGNFKYLKWDKRSNKYYPIAVEY